MIKEEANAGLISPGRGNPCQTRFLKFKPDGVPMKR